MKNCGKVYIIGAGPGDCRLMTLKAVECLREADVIVYDRLVGDKALKYAGNDTELVYVGKTPDCHGTPQDEINKLLVDMALKGKKVARLKGGDPFVFGRGGEECEILAENGIEFEVVPGVTSAVAVPAYAGIPVTHRDYCSSLHIITGHEKPGKDAGTIDYSLLAKIGGTLVFLMGVKNLKMISENLIMHGKNEKTPVAVIEKGTTSGQRMVAGTLRDISEKASAEGIKSPAVIVVGYVVSLGEKLKWFPKGKLAGKRIRVTRPKEQAGKLVGKIEELGGEAVEFPTVKILDPVDFGHFDEVLDNIRRYGWIVFTSANGVERFFGRMRVRKLDIRVLCGIKLGAVGEATAQKLNQLGLNVDYVPKNYTTGELLNGLLKLIKPGERALLARTDIAAAGFAECLRSNGIDCDNLVVYRTAAEDLDKGDAVSLLEKGLIDFITFTSPSAVKNFVSMLGEEKLRQIALKSKVLCIGPVTAGAAVDSGLKVAAVADVYTIEGLVDKIVEIAVS